MSVEDKVRKVQRQGLDWVVGHFLSRDLDKRAEQFVSLFAEFIPSKAHVLDIGGGWGFYSEPLKRLRDCQVTVLDIVEPAFRKVPVVIYGGEEMPFPDKSFDVSLLVTMLHHVQTPEKLLQEAMRVTRRFVVVVEDLYRHGVGRMWTVLRDKFFNLEFVGHPCQFRQKEEWFRCFRKLGLKLESEKEIYTFLLGFRILNGIFVLSCADE